MATATLIPLAMNLPAPVALAAGTPLTSIPLPFEGGDSVQILQGYNGGTHHDASVYGLDLVLSGDGTSGAPVLSPIDGAVAWAFPPGEKTGCIQVTATDGSFGTMLCHVMLDRPFTRGERVTRGQQLGTVGAAGMVGNNGAPHVHMELHRAGHGNPIVPFSTSQGGLPLDGLDLPVTGAFNEHAWEGPLTSSNLGPVTADASPSAPSAVAAPLADGAA